ncbi:DNA glycosylase AlkZ-like family protein [uncultured Pseudokineococcus sp.]|uniref:DNA glycosylase AlkZ-like family protein n=1 Tax=uncultured Pseudokineococcus sp. TaxID=1642928 RepID=UPI00260BC664|nr:crosslink repair DNA glycosylase YcaQ family protein [uncultured Pseudokineococcus sp.]
MAGPAVPALPVTRRRALSARLVAQQLDARTDAVAELAVLDVGLADTPYGSARVAASARTRGPLDDVGRAGGPLPLVWATRGAPHVHRVGDLPALARALHPRSDEDVRARLTSPQAAAGRALGLEAWRLATAAARAVAAEHGGSVAKGDLSRGVSDRVPAELTHWCRPCDAQHVTSLVFQPTAFQAGLALDTSARTLVLRSLDDWPEGDGPDAAAATAHLRRLLDLHGPASPGDLAALAGTSVRALRPALPEDLVPVEVDGRRALATPSVVALLEDPAVEERAAASVRLLPPGDPWLQSRDREVTVPDTALRKDVWRILGNPGVVLAGPEVVGTWRAKAGSRRASGRRDDITVTAVGDLSAAVRAALEDEARRVGVARGADDVRLDVQG